MKTLTVAYIESSLRKACVAAPLNIPKIIQALKHNEELMHQALNYFAMGLLNHYHMLPGNGDMEF